MNKIPYKNTPTIYSQSTEEQVFASSQFDGMHINVPIERLISDIKQDLDRDNEHVD